jgi:hypothetical protein
MILPLLDCLDERRRDEVRRRERNGLDYLEVSDDQLRLTVYFLGAAPEGLTAENFRITGGRRIRDIRIVDMQVCPQVDPELDNCVVLTVDRPGDFSTYTLCLVDLPEDSPFDPRYRCIEFSFKVACPTELDCKAVAVCPAEPDPHTEISYLAKDYASFRRLILDRLAVVMPEWTERHVPDIGITLVELLAYTGDYLSYYQDAVGTEAYLGTARQRISVRRHARLVDYRMHEGCNARAWVHVHTSTDGVLPAAQLSFLTRFDDMPDVDDRVLRWEDLRAVPVGRFEVFEPLVHDDDALLEFRVAHNEIRFYTWGDAECCLPRGATSATLMDSMIPPPDEMNEEETEETEDTDETEHTDDIEDADGNAVIDVVNDAISADVDPDLNSDSGGVMPDRVLDLEPGDILIFEEVIGPKTGAREDADPAHRHAVRLTRVEPVVDELYGQPLLEIEWAAEDALPFAFCLSAIGPAPACAPLGHVSVVRGNVVLVDHGRRLEPEDIGRVPVEEESATCERERQPADVVRRAGPFRPVLRAGPLTFSEPLPAAAPASRLLEQDPRRALPSIRLSSQPDPDRGEASAAVTAHAWQAQADLLASGADDHDYVVEVDDRGRAHLRFGDGESGRAPEPDLVFQARYRVGNGRVGNVGADTIRVAVTGELFSGITLEPRNPLPARGGTPAEPVADAKLFAPHAFRHVLERAVTPADYAELAGRYPGVQSAAAEARWNGSWYEVRVAVDPLGAVEADPALLDAVHAYLYRYRRIGHDLAVRPAHYVALDIAVEVCVEPGFLRGHVKAALGQRFSNRRLADGTLGFFHPDELSFGDGISLSRLVAAVQMVPGVASATVTKLERQFDGPAGELGDGFLPIGPLEIARVHNDPDFPEDGRIRFDLRGGR